MEPGRLLPHSTKLATSILTSLADSRRN